VCEVCTGYWSCGGREQSRATSVPDWPGWAVWRGWERSAACFRGSYWMFSWACGPLQGPHGPLSAVPSWLMRSPQVRRVEARNWHEIWLHCCGTRCSLHPPSTRTNGQTLCWMLYAWQPRHPRGPRCPPIIATVRRAIEQKSAQQRHSSRLELGSLILFWVWFCWL